MTGSDEILTVWTDSMELYQSRLDELCEAHGEYTELDAAADYERYLLGQDIDNLGELTYRDRKRVHNLKYYTWVEQQGKTYEEIQAQWYDPDYWTSIQAMADPIDELIEAFNAKVAELDRRTSSTRWACGSLGRCATGCSPRWTRRPATPSAL